MGLTKLMPIQGWIFLAVLVVGGYFAYGAFGSYGALQNVPAPVGVSTPAPVIADDDLAVARRVLNSPADIAIVDALAARMASASPSELPRLQAEAQSLRIRAEAACILVVGMAANGDFEILSRKDGWVRPSVRCVTEDGNGRLVAVKGASPVLPWLNHSQMSALPPLRGGSLVKVGEKSRGYLFPTWLVEHSG